ncbi:hypothetical protein POW24_32300, partial [Pseudomonas aeruginosa]|nr:hypothetical protein [Pseudomonas aeruginosa]
IWKKTLPPLNTNRHREGVGRKTSRDEVGLIHYAISDADSLITSPQGGYSHHMKEMHKHTSHPDLVKRLKRAEGHLRGSKPEPPKIPSADQRGLSRARSMG